MNPYDYIDQNLALTALLLEICIKCHENDKLDTLPESVQKWYLEFQYSERTREHTTGKLH